MLRGFTTKESTCCLSVLDKTETLTYFVLEVCGYTRTRGFTRTRPVGAGRVGISRVGSGTAKVIPGTVSQVFPVPTLSFGVTLSPLDVAVNSTNTVNTG